MVEGTSMLPHACYKTSVAPKGYWGLHILQQCYRNNLMVSLVIYGVHVVL